MRARSGAARQAATPGGVAEPGAASIVAMGPPARPGDAVADLGDGIRRPRAQEGAPAREAAGRA
jgi:hypothetical protein